MIIYLKIKASRFTQTWTLNVNERHGGIVNIRFMSNHFPVKFNMKEMEATARVPLKKAVSPLDRVLGIHENTYISDWVEPAKIEGDTVTFDFTNLLRGGYL